MKKADKVTSFDLVRSYYKVKNLRELFGLDKFYQLIKNNGLLLPDLYQKTSWGIINGKPVLIDFGFTKDVRRYYKLL
jgi:ribosomal silencing factor RsfS